MKLQLAVCCVLGGIMVWLSSSHLMAQDAAPTQRVYIGTYTGDGSKGIYQSVLDLKTGKLSPPELSVEVTSPSFLAIHPSQKLLYAVMEISDFQGKVVYRLFIP